MDQSPVKEGHSVGQLSKQDFDNAVSNTRMKKKTVDIAREVIVDGLSPNEVSKKYNVSVQWVNSSCDRILAATKLDFLTVSFQVPLAIHHDVSKIVDSCVKIYQASEKLGE